MQDEPKIIVGLDIGTTSVKAVVGMDDGQNISIVAASEKETSGMRRGIVSDLATLSQTIDGVLGDVEKASGRDIDSATVSVNGTNIVSSQVDGMIIITGQDITNDEVDRLKELVVVGKVPDNRTIIETIPHEYILDGQEGIKDPVGMTGSRLELKATVISVLTPSLESLKKASSLANVEPQQIKATVLAAARAILTEKQAENGVLVLDIGGSTIGMAIYESGDLQHLSVLPLGGNSITNDLALGLKIHPEVAELVKITHAGAIFSDIDKKVAVKYKNKNHQFNLIDIDEIVKMRLEDVFELINKWLSDTGYANKLPSGVVITGGGSNLRGIANYAQNALGLVTEIAKTQYAFKGLNDKISKNEFSVAIGLMLYDQELTQSNDYVVSKKNSDNIFNKIKNIIFHN